MVEWRPTPGLWAGRTVAVLAGGPSLTPQAVEGVREHVRIVINNAFRLAPDADVLLAADAAWWRAHPDARAFPGVKLCCQRVGALVGVSYLRPRYVGGGSNSALQGAYLAAELGAARLVLLGVDLDPRRLTHWHGPHGPGLRNPTARGFALARRAWERFARLPGRPEVVNASALSALECFPRHA